MNIARLSPTFSVSAQIRPEDVPEIAAAGFQGIVNNRPDGEGPDQPLSLDIESEAKRLGLDYEHVPIVPGQIDETQVRRLDAFLSRAKGPVLGFCRTGARAAQLWALQQASGGKVDEILAAASRAGHDLTPLRPRLEQAVR